MGRAPCCDKANVKRGPWSPEEDAKLKAYIERHGTGGNWIALPQKIGLKRCGKSCRLRWLNYLRPDIKHGGFTEEEDNIICSLYISIGSRWSIIAAQLPGRTDNDIKNYWNTRLKKKLFGKHRKEMMHRGNNQKQEKMFRKGMQNFLASDNVDDQKPYWPELPLLQQPIIPYTNGEPRFNDHHASIRNLLIKLGGRFSDNGQPFNGAMNLHFPIDNSPAQASYQQSLDLLSAAQFNAPSTMVQSLLNVQYNIHGAYTSMMVQDGQSSVAAEPGQVSYNNNNPQNLEGLEFLYRDVLNDKSETISRESIDWGEMSSLDFTSGAASLNECFQKDVLQQCTFNELRYPGLQQ